MYLFSLLAEHFISTVWIGYCLRSVYYVFKTTFPSLRFMFSILRHSKMILFWSLGPIFLQKLLQYLNVGICSNYTSYSFFVKMSPSPHLHLLPFWSIMACKDMDLSAIKLLFWMKDSPTFILFSFISPREVAGTFLKFWAVLTLFIIWFVWLDFILLSDRSLRFLRNA